MFENIGNKIKSVAKAICILFIIYFVIIGLIQMTHHAFWSGLITMVGGSLIAWISTLTVYGFGELIEDTKAIKLSLSKTENSLKEVSENTAPPSKPMPTGWGLGKCELCDKKGVLVCNAKITDETGAHNINVCKECFIKSPDVSAE